MYLHVSQGNYHLYLGIAEISRTYYIHAYMYIQFFSRSTHSLTHSLIPIPLIQSHAFLQGQYQCVCVRAREMQTSALADQGVHLCHGQSTCTVLSCSCCKNLNFQSHGISFFFQPQQCCRVKFQVPSSEDCASTYACRLVLGGFLARSCNQFGIKVKKVIKKTKN